MRTQAIWGHTPMNRFGESQELIGAAVFLAAPKASSFITGTDIRVDGGFLSQTIQGSTLDGIEVRSRA